MRTPLSLFTIAFLVFATTVVPCVRSDDTKLDTVAILKGHKEAVYGVAFSPDGKFLLTTSGEPSVKLYDIATTKEMKTFGGPNGHKQLVLSVVMSPDGSQFATAGQDNSVKIWDFPSNKHIREYPTTDDSRCVTVSPDGTKLAGGSKDGKIRIWTAADGKQLFEIPAHTGAVSGVAFNAQGTQLVSTGIDGNLKYWNVADGKAVTSFVAHPSPITGLIHSPTTTVYTSGSDGTLRYWGPPTPSRNLAAPFKDAVSSLSLSPDATQTIATSGNTVRLSTIANGATTKEYTVTSGNITTAALAPGAALVAAGTNDRRVHLWQTKDGALLTSAISHGGGVTSLAFNPTANLLATTGKDGLVRLWAVPAVPTRNFTPGDVVRAAVMAPDAKRIATSGGDKILRLYKLDNLKAVERQITSPVVANTLAFSPDSATLVTAGDDGVIRFWSQAKGEPVATIGGHSGAVGTVAYLGTAQVLSASADGSLKLWTVPAAQAKNNFAHAGVVTSATLTPDGQKLLTGCDDKQVRLWNLANGQVEKNWTGPTLAITAVAISPKGDRVAAGSADKTVTVWEATTNKEVKKFATPSAPQCVALTADGKHVVAGLADGVVKVLDLTTGKDAESIDGHKGAISTLTFTPKGEMIYGGAEGTVLVRAIGAKAPASSWKHTSAISAIALGVNGTKAAVGGASKEVKIYDIAKGKDEVTITTPAEVRGVAYSPDGKKLAVAGGDGKTRVYSADGSLEEHFSHDGPVNAVAFATDNKRVLSGGADKTARVWPLSLVWQGKHGAAVTNAVASTRGIVTSSADGVVRVWAAADGKLTQSFRGDAGAVHALTVRPDAAVIVTSGADKTVRVWDWAKMPATQMAGKDVDKPALQMQLSGLADALALSPDGKRLAASVPGAKPTDNRVQVFDTTIGKELISLGEPEGLSGKSLAFLADNRTLFAGGDKSVNLIDVNIQASFEAHPGGANSVAFHNAGTQVLTGGADKSAKLWTVATGKLDKTFGPVGDPVSSVGFSRDFTYAAASAGKSLKIWNIADGKELFSFAMPESASSLSFSSDKTRIATANVDGRCRTWELATKAEGQAFQHTAAVTGVVFHPSIPTQLITSSADKTVAIHTHSLARLVNAGSAINGIALATNQGHVLSAGANGKLTFFNVNSGNPDRTIDGDDKGVSSVAVTRNVTTIAIGGAQDKKIRLFNYADPKAVSVLTAPSVPKLLSFSSDGKSLVAGGPDGSLTTWDVGYIPNQPVPPEFGKVLQSSAHAKEVADIAFPVQGATFYTAGADKTVKAWKVASDAPTKNFAHPQAANCLAFNKAGTELITGGADGKLRVWDLAKGTVTKDIAAHVQPNNTSIYCVAYSPDEKQIVTGSIDQTLKLFNAADGKLIRDFRAYKDKEFPKGHQEAVLSVAFSPDGKFLASGGMDKTIKIWNVADGTVLRELINPAYKPEVADAIHAAHPGWVNSLRWLSDGKKLISSGPAPQLKGHLATWDPASGKLLGTATLAHGSLHGLSLSPDEKFLAVATGGSLRTGEELNLAVILKVP